MVPDLGLPLAGADAVDCGIVEANKPRQRHRLLNCARKALERGKPVRFGTGYFGIDAFGCEVIVVDESRNHWLVTFDWDLSVPGDRPKSFVGRCPAIDLDWKDPEGTGRFGPHDCAFDEDGFRRANTRHP
jgi:hypothetical protein